MGSQGLLSQVGRDSLVVKVTFEQRSDKSIRLCGHVEEGHTSAATHVKDTEQCMLEGPTAQQGGQHDQERKHQRTDGAKITAGRTLQSRRKKQAHMEAKKPSPFPRRVWFLDAVLASPVKWTC